MTPKSPQRTQETVDPNQDRYVTFPDAVRRILGEADLPDGPVERLEMLCHASGEVTYRVWEARADEPVGGYLPAS